MTINILSEEIINQIAAGEVIENPSAVIKELIENSIDSKATQIDIDIEDYGLKKIVVTDNGFGISKEDLEKAPLRHATSKIQSFNDLYNINSMGFRGEALASIFSISNSKIISKREGEVISYEISSKDLKVKEGGSGFGTSVYVENIFYNTPARKKYLKSNNIELKSILDIVNRYEVFYNNIKFTLKHNGKILVNKPIFKNEIDNLYYVLGKELKDNLIYFEKEVEGIKIKGFIANPSEITYSFKKNQYVYVNNRYVKSKIISDAIYSGFGTNLMTGRHPFFVVFVDVDPEIVDVNVHPTKIEIRFENELDIYEFVKECVVKAFEENSTFKKFEPEFSEVDTKISSHFEDVEFKDVKKPQTKSKDYFSKEVQREFNVKEDEVEYIKIPEKLKEEILESEERDKGPLFEELKNYKILGQLNKTYILVETDKEFLLVDQHVCEEKYYFEKFKENLKDSKSKSQKLLSGEVVHLSNSEMLLYEENKDVINSVGFGCEKFGENEIIVREVPTTVRREVMNATNLRDILYDILINKKIKCVEDEKYSKIASMACRISVMAGDELTNSQMHRMVENLRYLKQPFNCPHGRPTFLKYEFKDLEKKFKRIV